ncbi:hypothetical protein AXG93_1193s1120 [Marchantia polymorpha subsp. ruderalis]|uniref:Uncharacterized protein n=1 Tax=Marchantia polymorpha subsp. ruderalis TaxID=1480154 RepID=A0A176WN02_MARPO|nr:hypothetical protein AXG93_1193s1120 [Marchantia polymorpha subsp. ruderalis]
MDGQLKNVDMEGGELSEDAFYILDQETVLILNFTFYPDDDMDDDFLSWIPSNVMARDKSLKIDEGPPVKAKRKQFISPKIDVDLDFEMPSFEIDLAALEFNPPPKSQPAKSQNLDGNDEFSFDISGSENTILQPSREIRVDSPGPSRKSVNNSVPQEVSSLSDTYVPVPESKSSQRKSEDTAAFEEPGVKNDSSSEVKNAPVVSKEDCRSAAQVICNPSKNITESICEGHESEHMNGDGSDSLSPNTKRASWDQSTSSSHLSKFHKPELPLRSENHSAILSAQENLKQSEAMKLAQITCHPSRPDGKVTTDLQLLNVKTLEYCPPGEGESIKMKEDHTRLNDPSSTPVREKQCLFNEGGAPQGSQTGANPKDRPDNAAPSVDSEKTNVQEKVVADPIEGAPVVKSVYFEKKTLQTLPQVSTNGVMKTECRPRGDNVTSLHKLDGSEPVRDSGNNSFSRNDLIKEPKVVEDLVVANTDASVDNEVGPKCSIDIPKTTHISKENRGKSDKGRGVNKLKRKLTNENKNNDQRQVRCQTDAKVTPKRDETKQVYILNTNFPAACLNASSSPRFALESTTLRKGKKSVKNVKSNKPATWIERLQSSAKLPLGGLQSRTAKQVKTDSSKDRHGAAELVRINNIDTNRMRSNTAFQFNQGIQPTHHSNVTAEPSNLPPKKTAEQELNHAGATTQENIMEARTMEESQQSRADAETTTAQVQSSEDLLLSERRGLIEQANLYSDKLEEVNDEDLENAELRRKRLDCEGSGLQQQTPDDAEPDERRNYILSNKIVSKG